MMEGKVTIRGVDWKFYSQPRYGPLGKQLGETFRCYTSDKVVIRIGDPDRRSTGELDDGGYCGGFDTMGEAIEVAVGISARTNPFPDEVFD